VNASGTMNEYAESVLKKENLYILQIMYPYTCISGLNGFCFFVFCCCFFVYV